jgi:hypothetical protein
MKLTIHLSATKYNVNIPCYIWSKRNMRSVPWHILRHPGKIDFQAMKWLRFGGDLRTRVSSKLCAWRLQKAHVSELTNHRGTHFVIQPKITWNYQNQAYGT